MRCDWHRKGWIATACFSVTLSLGDAGCGSRLWALEPTQRSKGSEPTDRVTAVPPAVDTLRDALFQKLGLRKGMRVAEIGLGRGWFLFRAAQAVGARGTVYGTDIDSEAIRSMEQQIPHIDPASGKVVLRLCRDGRDTALDDLPPNHLDVILMVDSLCFEGSEMRDANIAYLGRFLRLLRPGGRLIHHMDCKCDISIEGVEAQFLAAGFDSRVERLSMPHDPESDSPTWRCADPAAATRHAWVGVFRKPDSKDPSGNAARTDAGKRPGL